MKIEDHFKAYQQHRDAINWAIDRGLKNSQRIIGTHVSRAIVELFSALLHKLHLIDMGFQINHRWLKSDKVSERFPDFPKKEVLMKRMVKLELDAENLAYGAEKSEEEIKSALLLFNEIEKMILEMMEKST